MGTAVKRQRSREAPELSDIGRKPPCHLSCPEHIDADSNFGLQTFLNRVLSVGVLHSLSGRSGDSNARRVWPTKRSRLWLDWRLVDPAFERASNMSCLQNNGLEDCRTSHQHSESRDGDGCQCERHVDLSSHCSHLQILRAFYVFQRRANRYRRTTHSATQCWRSRLRL